MSQVYSPFLKDIHQIKERSKRIRKKIYKFMAKHPAFSGKQNHRSFKQLLAMRALPSPCNSILSERPINSIEALREISISKTISLDNIKMLADMQERQIQLYYFHSKREQSTAQKSTKTIIPQRQQTLNLWFNDMKELSDESLNQYKCGEFSLSNEDLIYVPSENDEQSILKQKDADLENKRSSSNEFIFSKGVQPF